MIKNENLLNILKIILDKKEIIEEDLDKIEDLTLNKHKLNGLENDIDLKELRAFKNLKTLTLINFCIDAKDIENINEMKLLWAIQFTRCNFKEAILINQNVKYLILDRCENIKYELINNNETIKLIEAFIDLNQITRLYETEMLFLQDCDIKNIIKLYDCTKLKYLNLDGSKVDDNNIFEGLSKNIQISYTEEYNPKEGL